MNSVFIPYIPAGMTVNDLKTSLEIHYGIDLIGIDMVRTERGYMFFAHFTTDLREADVAAIDATTQYKLTTATGRFFYVRRNTGTLDITDPFVHQILFYGGNTYLCTCDQIIYTLINNEWVEECPPEIIGIYIHRQFAPYIPLPPLSRSYMDAQYAGQYAEIIV